MKSIFAFVIVFLAQTAQSTELFFEEDHSLPLVFVNIALKGGATQDPDGKNGVTDVMTKLLLRGTKFKTKSQVYQTLDQLGAQLEVETRAEFVVLRGKVLSENIGPFLNLLSEILTSPSFRSNELELLKKEQVSLILDQLNNDQKLIKTRFDSVYFQGHPYSKSNMGKAKEVQSITASDIQNQYRKIYDQSRLMILAAGDTEDSSFNSFKSKLERDLNFNSRIESIPPFKNAPKKLGVFILDKPDRTQTQITLAQEGLGFSSPILDSIQLGNFSFGGGSFLSKLMIELRVKRGWTYGAGSAFKMGSQPHTWRVSFFPKNADTPAAIVEALKLIRDLRDHGITREEFESAKKSMINSAGFNYNTPAKRIENLLVEKIFNLPIGYHQNLAKRIEDLTLEQVNAALKEFIRPDQIKIGLVATAKISGPEIAKALGISEKEIEIIDYAF